MHRGETERRIDRALKELPLLRAPDTLLPRVSAAVQAWMRRPWYERAWFTWPLALRVVGITTLALMLASASVVAPEIFALARASAADLVANLLERVPVGLLRFEAALSTLLEAWQIVSARLLAYAAAAVFLLALTSALCVAALNRVAMREPMLP
jgi:hypothetical protein